jgi:hypothetical protein
MPALYLEKCRKGKQDDGGYSSPDIWNPRGRLWSDLETRSIQRFSRGKNSQKNICRRKYFLAGGQSFGQSSTKKRAFLVTVRVKPTVAKLSQDGERQNQ